MPTASLRGRDKEKRWNWSSAQAGPGGEVPGTDMGAAQLLNRETRSRAQTPWGLSPLLAVPVMMGPGAVTAPQTLT